MKRITTLVVGLTLMLPGSALAQGSSTCQAYNPQLCSVGSGQSVASAASPSASQGTLPFTGLDLTLLAVGGGGLLGAGLVMRRLTRRLD